MFDRARFALCSVALVAMLTGCGGGGGGGSTVGFGGPLPVPTPALTPTPTPTPGTTPTPQIATAVAFVGTVPNVTQGQTVDVKVEVVDQNGNLISNGASTAVTLGSSGGNLAGGGTVMTTGGIADFPAVSFGSTGTFTLNASAAGLAGATSNNIVVSSNLVPTSLQFTTTPNDPSFAGTALSGQGGSAITVQVLDQNGQPLAASGNVSVSLNAPNSPGTALTAGSTTTVATNANGQAVFNNLVVDPATLAGNASQFSLTAAGTGVTAAQSGTFSVNVPPANLTISVNPNGPANQVAGQAFTVTAVATDASNNPVQGFPVTLSVSNGGSANLTNADLAGGTTVSTDNTGTATFNNVVIDSASTGVTLTANANGTPTATSAAFNVSGPVASISVVAPPSPNPVGSGVNFSMVVQVLDANGSPIANANVPVTLTLLNGNNQTIGDNAGATSQTFVGGTDGNGQVTINTHVNGTGTVTLQAAAGAQTTTTPLTVQ